MRMLLRILLSLPVVCLATGTLWAANDPFVDKWKLNPSKSKLTDRMKVEAAGPNKYALDFGSGVEIGVWPVPHRDPKAVVVLSFVLTPKERFSRFQTLNMSKTISIRCPSRILKFRLTRMSWLKKFV